MKICSLIMLMLVLMLICLGCLCDGKKAQVNNLDGKHGAATPNSLEERIEALQNSVAHILTRLQRQDEKQDAIEHAISRGQSEMKAIVWKGFNATKNDIHSIKKIVLRDVIKFPNPVYGDVNAKYFVQGHVEIRHNNVWGTICDDYLDSSVSKGNNIANVLCRMQGYESGVYDQGAYKQSSATKSDKIWIDTVECTGNESNVGECYMSQPWVNVNCGHGEDIGIRCYI